MGVVDAVGVMMMAKLFPHGLGTRAVLALVVVMGAVGLMIAAREVELLSDMALVVLGWYFIQRHTAAAVNGNGAGGGTGK